MLWIAEGFCTDLWKFSNGTHAMIQVQCSLYSVLVVNMFTQLLNVGILNGKALEQKRTEIDSVFQNSYFRFLQQVALSKDFAIKKHKFKWYCIIKDSKKGSQCYQLSKISSLIISLRL